MTWISNSLGETGQSSRAMRTRPLSLAIVSVLVLSTSAMADDAETVIRNNERLFNAAIKDRDVARAEALQTEDYFLAVGRPGDPLAVFPRQQWLAVLRQYVITDMKLGEMVVRVYGQTATVAYPYYQAATSHGDDLTGWYTIVDIWRKQADESWKVCARYSTRFNRSAEQRDQLGQPKAGPK